MAVSRFVFVSYGGADRAAAALMYEQLTRQGLDVFRDVESLRAGELWLERLQEAVDGCGAFVLLIGRDGVRRWVGAETQAALVRFFGPRQDTDRLPIFPVLLAGSAPEALPAFLRLFQATPWDGAGPLPDTLLESIRTRTLPTVAAASFEGCPFVGLASYRPDQAHLFFGRQKETLDALSCFSTRTDPPVRWLEINGNSGSGKSSLMNAGLLPLIEQGWLWPHTNFAYWTRIGPMLPGEKPMRALAEALTRCFRADDPRLEMADVRARLDAGDDLALADWLSGRKRDEQAFLLAIDQFEELFTTADADERRRFDALLAEALADPVCPLFLLSTVRSDFLDRIEEDLPRLVAARNRLARQWTLAPIGPEGLREVIDGPARLAGLDVGEVRELILAEAQDEPGALPLVENALRWLWENRQGNRLDGRLLREQGGLAGLLSQGANDLLGSLGPQRERALELLLALVNVDMDTRRHTRRRVPLADAVAWAGGGSGGRMIVDRLAGRRRPDGALAEGPLRLLTIAGETGKNGKGDARVSLIHETLIRSKRPDADGRAQPYWPMLWNYIERNAERAARRERLTLMAREWKDRTGFARLRKLAGWSSLFGFRGLAAPGSLEQRYLCWSRARAGVQLATAVLVLGFLGEGLLWATVRGLPLEVLPERWSYVFALAQPPVPVLAPIPAGTFMMGSERDQDSQPVHPVTFARPFRLGQTEVTFQQWDACVAAGGCGGYRPSDQGWGRKMRPVINVSWQDVQAYVGWLSGRLDAECRLPSEAEWEYAARAGTGREYGLPAPDGSEDLGQGLANCRDCGSEWDGWQTAPVIGEGKFKPNKWGLYDMHGNVWEWVEDCYRGDYEGASADGRAWQKKDGGDCSSRVVRGGSWGYFRVLARASYRSWFRPVIRDGILGFRVVCSSPIDEH
ncbi:MAG: SUMF1/EgtB/PvdO family nonheme iron enzyme [Rhodospirillales bacterium]|nr:SUMF1/EgtB/PvdO family nonheme iron enzyme [Rhodospirillales bacterium]